MDPVAILKRYFGHGAFRPGQEALIGAILGGRDVLGVMPTGAGKSVCYQLPALMLGGLTLVISPLISLMKDQVAQLTQSGIPAAYLNSSLNPTQQAEALRRAREGAYKILYVAPERLSAPNFLSFARQAAIPLVAVDEAHCVSQWGQDFRPSYLQIDGFVKGLPARPVVAAFTATATARVKEDIEKLLDLQNPLSLTTGFDRPNLFFAVARPKDKQGYLQSFVRGHAGQSGIVYCATRKAVESVCAKLRGAGVAATRYHAGLDGAERRANQEDFLYDRAPVMVATNAFGMGIDKSNVSYVVHYNMPKDVESYYQEAGRAGRDGAPAECVLLFSPADVRTARMLIDSGDVNEALSEEEREAVRKRDLERLGQMERYCRASGCLRAFLLGYFGEAAPGACGNCGNCRGETRQVDITLEAQKILSGVARVEKKYRNGLGISAVVFMLSGSKEKRVFQLGLEKLPTYGALRGTDQARIRLYIDELIENGCLRLTEGEYPVLRLADRARSVLFEGERVTINQRVPSQAERAESPRKRKRSAPARADDDLFSALKALRYTLAQKEGVPAFMVFSNATLLDMAARQPVNPAEFLEVSGVGSVKANKYARQFTQVIRKWRDEHEDA